MIVVRLSGGLGNQMFQFAAAYAASLRLGVECRVDVSAFQRSTRRYELGHFLGAPKFAKDCNLPLRSRLAQWGIPGIVGDKLDAMFGSMCIFEETSAFVFDQRFLSLGDNTYLIGYFQSEKYFGSVAGGIRKQYTFRDPPNSTNKNMLHEIKNTSTVSVHIRRSDYVSNPETNTFHGTCSLEYYETAFRIVAERQKNPCFFVFSDDPLWARMNVKPPLRVVYVDHNNGQDAYEDMRLMSNCQHHIIANSSFSWWAAWLNPSADKIVIAPRQWLADTSVQTGDLLPDKWIQV